MLAVSKRGRSAPRPAWRSASLGRLALLAASMRAGGAAWASASCSAPTARSPRWTRPTAAPPTSRCAPRCARGTTTSPPSTRRSPSCSRRLTPSARSRRRRSTTRRRSRCRASPCRATEAATAGRRGRSMSCPRRGREVELLRDKDFADYTDAERAPGAAADPAARAARPARAAAAAPARPAAAVRRRTPRARTCAARSAPRCAPAATRSSATGASRPTRPRPLVLVCDVSGLDGALRAHAAPVHAGVRRGAPARRGVRVRHPADARHARARAAATPTARSTAPPPRRTTGPAARASARRSPRSTASTAAALGRGAVVVILSDGWDRGDPAQLAARDGAPAALLAPARLAQPAQGAPGLRAAHARDAGRAAARRPFPAPATRCRRWRSWPS